MFATDSTAVDLADPELITQVRAGDVAAYGALFARHRDAAIRLARLLTGSADADDLVAGAFEKVLGVLLAGGGPDVAFRAYLLTAVRRLHVDRVRNTQRVTPTDDIEAHDVGVPFTDTAVQAFEGGAAAKAFASLPERWQLVLWHLEVENQKPSEIAPLLGISANSVSALAYRAREGLRQAFLTMHAAENTDEHCERTRDLLGGYVRAALSRRDSAQVRDHLEGCRRCTGAYLELVQVNSSLAALLGPVVLGGAAAAYVGGGVATGAVGLVLAGLDRAKDLVSTNLAIAGAAAAAVVVAAVAGAFALSAGTATPPQAGPPRASQTPGASAPATSPAPPDLPPTPGAARSKPAPQAPAAETTPGQAETAAVLPSPVALVAAPLQVQAPRPEPAAASVRPKPRSPEPSHPAPAPGSTEPEPTTADLDVAVTLGPEDDPRVRVGCRLHRLELKCVVGPDRSSRSVQGRTRNGGDLRAPVSVGGRSG